MKRINCFSGRPSITDLYPFEIQFHIAIASGVQKPILTSQEAEHRARKRGESGTAKCGEWSAGLDAGLTVGTMSTARGSAECVGIVELCSCWPASLSLTQVVVRTIDDVYCFSMSLHC